jgi:hypothetical protein
MRTTSGLLLLALLLPACSVKASFVASEPSYQAARRGREPVVYLTQAPAEPYRVVGTVALYGVDEDEPEDGLDAAIAKGRAYGCDVLVERAVHERAVNAGPPAASAPRGDATYIGMSGPGPSVNVDLEAPSVNIDLGNESRSGRNRRELVCGVWQDQPPTPQESEAPSVLEAPLPEPSAPPEPVPMEI